MKTSEIRIHNGRPTLFVDGRETPQAVCSVRSPHMEDFIRAGFHIYDTHPYTPLGWIGPDRYDHTDGDAYLQKYLDQKSDALLIPRIWLGYPEQEWIGQAYPEDLTRQEDGQPLVWPVKNPHSFASDVFARRACDAIEHFIRHTEERFGENILGYVIGGGPCGEWFHWHVYVADRVEDYSPVAQQAFRQYLRQRYQNDPAALSESWQRRVTFETAALPSRLDRFAADVGLLRDPSKGRAVQDFYRWFADILALRIEQFCAAAKRATGGRKVNLVFYGYWWTNYPRPAIQRSGHLAMNKVLNSPDVDIIVSPYHYDDRNLGGVVTSQTLPMSVELAGKLYLNEADPDTCVKVREDRLAHAPKTPQQSRQLIVRDYAYHLTKRVMTWFMDLRAGQYHDEQLIATLKQMRQLDKVHQFSRRANATQVAVVLDEESFFQFHEHCYFLMPLLNYTKQECFARFGAPFDAIRLEDLERPNLPDYRVFIFPQAVSLNDAQRKLVRRVCCRDGKALLWFYAPGIINKTLSASNMSDLTGIQLDYSTGLGELHVDLLDIDHPLLAGTLPRHYGTDLNIAEFGELADHRHYPDPHEGFKIAPRCYSIDPQAVELGRLAQINKPGLVAKDMDDWMSVFSSPPLLPPGILRNLARLAGAHIYTDAPAQIFACEGYVGAFFHAAGRHRIDLPQACDRVVDLLTGGTVAENCNSFTVPSDANQAFLWQIL